MNLILYKMIAEVEIQKLIGKCAVFGPGWDSLFARLLTIFGPAVNTNLPETKISVSRGQFAFGFSTDSQFNAFAGKSSTGNYFIIFYAGLYSLSNAVGEIVWPIILREKHGPIKDDKFENDKLKLKKLFRDYIDGKLLLSKPLFNDDKSLAFSFAILSFILCHEIAHIKMGHLDNSLSLYIKGIKLSKVSGMHLQEYEADYIGAMYYMFAHINEGADGPDVVWNTILTISITFCIIETIERLSITSYSSSHPLATDRITNLKIRFKEGLNSIGFSQLADIYDDLGNDFCHKWAVLTDW